jgi:hypothetical protein
MAKSKKSTGRPSGPTYDLELVKALAGAEGARLLTKRAEHDAHNYFGLVREQVFEKVAGLKAADFVKTMASEQTPGTFQDVYRPTITCDEFPLGIEVYCKVQVANGKLLVVISFHAS